MATDELCVQSGPSNEVIVVKCCKESGFSRRPQAAMVEMDDVTNGCIVVDREESVLSLWASESGRRQRRSPEATMVTIGCGEDVRRSESGLDVGLASDDRLILGEDSFAASIAGFTDGGK